MALQKTLSLLLLLLLTLLGLGLVQPSYGETMYERFLRQHVDSTGTGGTNLYCNRMMQIRGMTLRGCKEFNTFIHENIGTIISICSSPNIQCKNGMRNCHEGTVRVTDCRDTGSSKARYCSDRGIMGLFQASKCNYQATASTRHVVIACEGNPPVPVHFDR